MKIQVELKKWGNSLGLRIPFQIADNLQITENSKVSLVIEENRLIVEKENLAPSLDEILASIPDDFEYPEDIQEFANSDTVGREIL
jgi:antitoxin MazE